MRTGRTERVLGADDAVAWLTGRLADALTDIEIACHSRDVSVQASRRGARPGDAMTIDTFDATATVTDTTALDALRLTGVGRRKAYGAGLLTVQRID